MLQSVETALLYHLSAETSEKLFSEDQYFARVSSSSSRKKIVATSARVIFPFGRTVPSE